MDKARPTGTGSPPAVVQKALDEPASPPSPDALRQLEDTLGPSRRHSPRGKRAKQGQISWDYDDVVQQSFPASDPPPPPGPDEPPRG